jgi:hypothetical protein
MLLERTFTMRRIKPSKSEIKKFLDSAVIDPNQTRNYFERQLTEQGEPAYFEVRVTEYMAGAARIRERFKTTTLKGRKALLEEYAQNMRQAATALALAVGKVNEKYET